MNINIAEKIYVLMTFEPNDSDSTDANSHILGVFRRRESAEEFMSEYATDRLYEDCEDMEELTDALDNGLDPVDEIYHTHRISLHIETHYLA